MALKKWLGNPVALLPIGTGQCRNTSGQNLKKSSKIQLFFKQLSLANLREAGQKQREEIVNWIKSTDMSNIPQKESRWLSNMLNTYAEAIRARGDSK